VARSIRAERFESARSMDSRRSPGSVMDVFTRTRSWYYQRADEALTGTAKIPSGNGSAVAGRRFYGFLRRPAQYLCILCETSWRSWGSMNFRPRHWTHSVGAGIAPALRCNSSSEAITRSSLSFSTCSSCIALYRSMACSTGGNRPHSSCALFQPDAIQSGVIVGLPLPSNGSQTTLPPTLRVRYEHPTSVNMKDCARVWKKSRPPSEPSSQARPSREVDNFARFSASSASGRWPATRLN